MGITPKAVVAGPTRQPMPYGLFSTVNFPPSGADRWESGVTWEMLSCANPLDGVAEYQCPPGDVAVTFGSPGREYGEATSFTLTGKDLCSPIGRGGLEDAENRARQLLLDREEQMAETVFWTGSLSNTPHLVQGGGNSDFQPAPVKPARGLMELEDAISADYGSLGVIHMTRGLALALGGFLEVRGGRLYTKVGTPVIAGSGYLRTGPAGTPAPAAGTGWVIATPAVFGYRSDIFTSSAQAGDLLDRQRNDLYALAARSYLIGFDPCFVAGVVIDPSL